MSSPTGPSFITSLLGERREIIRNEALLMTQALIDSSPDIQKVLAFEGAFEGLLAVILQEGGIEGGVVVQDCLNVVDKLLRFNVSNQNYFRELNLPPQLAPLLLFPSPPPPADQPVPQQFSLQFWDKQKLANARVVVDIIGMLASGNSPGNLVRVLDVKYTLFFCLTLCALIESARANGYIPMSFGTWSREQCAYFPQNPRKPYLDTFHLSIYIQVYFRPFSPFPRASLSRTTSLHPTSPFPIQMEKNGIDFQNKPRYFL